MKKILVTGGAGYLGSTLVSILLSTGKHVTVLDNFMYGQGSLAYITRIKQLEIVRGDVRDHRLVAKLVKDADVVVPLAALVGAPACDREPSAAQVVNSEEIRFLCRLLSREQLVIYPNTNSGYGRGALCTENSELSPMSLYGKLKMEGERRVLERAEGDNSVVFRYATLFGMSPRMRFDLMVNDFVWRAVKDKHIVLFEGNFRRNFLHVWDAAMLISRAIDVHSTERALFGVYNAGDSRANMSKRQLCEEIKRCVPDFIWMESSTNKDPDQRDYFVSNKKLEDTGWEPRHDIHDGIEELIKGCQMYNEKPGNV